MRDERPRVGGERQQVHVPTAQDPHLQEAHQIRCLVAQEVVRRRLLEKTKVAVGVTEAIVEMKVLAAAPDARFGDPQETRVTWPERLLQMATEPRQLRVRLRNSAP